MSARNFYSGVMRIAVTIEGIVLQFVSGNFQKIRKNPLMPKTVEIFGKPKKFH
jgi:hypothetical protein